MKNQFAEREPEPHWGRDLWQREKRGTVEMFVSLKANKKRVFAFVLLVVVVVGACLLLNLKGDKAEPQIYYAASAEERVAFLESFGWTVDQEPMETREVMIPESFNDVYTSYNEMQKAQGFDLKPYAGFVCMQYKYQLENYPDTRDVYATLLVYDNQILGGDLACSEVDGFMHGFAPGSAKYGEDPAAAKAKNTAESGAEKIVENTNETMPVNPNDTVNENNTVVQETPAEAEHTEETGENRETMDTEEMTESFAEEELADTDAAVFDEEDGFVD